MQRLKRLKASVTQCNFQVLLLGGKIAIISAAHNGFDRATNSGLRCKLRYNQISM